MHAARTMNLSWTRAGALALGLATLLGGCGGPSVTDAGGDTATDGTGDSSANRPPRWVDPPATAMLDQGRHTRIDVRIEDPDGDAIVHSVTAPMGMSLTVEGTAPMLRWHLFADYTVQGEQALQIESVDARGARTVHSLTVTVRPLRWLRRHQWTADPLAREHAVMLLDGMRNEILLLGGSGYMPYGMPLGDSWRLNLATGAWTMATLDGDGLPAAGSRRGATLPDGTSYLFGGYPTMGTNTNDVFRVTLRDGGATTLRLMQRSPPSARSLHAFGYDPMSRRFALFGGVGSTILSDTWTMTLEGDTAVWTRVDAADGPTPRYGMFYGMDEERGRLIVWSGAQAFSPLDPANDAWALDVRATPPVWHQLTMGDEAGTPNGRRNGGGVFDPTGPRLFVFGGTADARTSEMGLWALDLEPGAERWARVQLPQEPPVRSSSFGVFDARRGEVFMGFGNTSSAVMRDVLVLGY